MPDPEASEGKLSVTDSRTGKLYDFPISNGAVRALGLRAVKRDPDEFGLMTYDPAYQNTASCRSAVTFIDGDRGILRYRGYPIEELAASKSFLEVAYLVLHGELPSADEERDWEAEISGHTLVDESITRLIGSLIRSAHPMGALVAAVAGLSTLYPEAKQVEDERVRRRQIVRLIAKMPTLAGLVYRHSRGLYAVQPEAELSYTGNLLNMMWRTSQTRYTPNPVLERALDVLLALHVDHEQNCSTSTMRLVGSSHADPYCAASAACSALYGPLHGGANEQVVLMLERIGSRDSVAEYIRRVKAGEVRLMGFGHRVYKNFDPRARLIKGVAEQVFEVTGRSRLLDIALEVERIALQDEYFVQRKLYPNVDFYSGIIYMAMGFPVEMFPVLFAIGRTPGWLTHWDEGMRDAEQKIGRPRQLYVGPGERHVPGHGSASGTQAAAAPRDRVRAGR